jgi:hypothetical protein
MWNRCLLYPVQNRVGSLTNFSANRGLEEAAIAYDTLSEFGEHAEISWSPVMLTIDKPFSAGCP